MQLKMERANSCYLFRGIMIFIQFYINVLTWSDSELFRSCLKIFLNKYTQLGIEKVTDQYKMLNFYITKIKKISLQMKDS